MSLGENLRTDQHVDLARPHVVEQPLEFVATTETIRVEPFDALARIAIGERLLDAFGAVAERHQFGRAARRTTPRPRLLRAAVMADQARAPALDRKSVRVGKGGYVSLVNGC